MFALVRLAIMADARDIQSATRLLKRATRFGIINEDQAAIIFCHWHEVNGQE